MEEIITTFQDLFVGLFAGMSTLAIISGLGVALLLRLAPPHLDHSPPRR